ncbi:cupin domain-containing protein [Micromonospora echinofusca]|uniref:Cupin domain-containing protein n=1 Tax=Micromonospora echinofusca TaxID=47858 RepID=A0ABS3VUV7_MICEH|nr:cupin domain-containing protein [Micromonospora echinofusca]MBO4208322.1 cupin domain-containing protein [Micromonospora echinofusca]
MLNPLLHAVAVNWDEIPATVIRPGVRRKVYSTDEVMLAWHELSVGMTLNPHRHDDFDQLVLILAGRCDYYVDGVAHDMTAGSMLLVPRGAEHYVDPTEGPCVNVDVFTPPRADFLPHAWRPAD